MVLREERGFIQFIVGALVVIGLVIVVVVGITMGLDRLYQEQSGESMISKESKIHEIRGRLREKREELAGDTAPVDEPAAANSPAREKTADERLAEVGKRLERQPDSAR